MTLSVISAKAGIQTKSGAVSAALWAPALAGVTGRM